jgi:hypothetical protein
MRKLMLTAATVALLACGITLPALAQDDDNSTSNDNNNTQSSQELNQQSNEDNEKAQQEIMTNPEKAQSDLGNSVEHFGDADRQGGRER